MRYPKGANTITAATRTSAPSTAAIRRTTRHGGTFFFGAAGTSCSRSAAMGSVASVTP